MQLFIYYLLAYKSSQIFDHIEKENEVHTDAKARKTGFILEENHKRDLIVEFGLQKSIPRVLVTTEHRTRHHSVLSLSLWFPYDAFKD